MFVYRLLATLSLECVTTCQQCPGKDEGPAVGRESHPRMIPPEGQEVGPQFPSGPSPLPLLGRVQRPWSGPELQHTQA